MLNLNLSAFQSQEFIVGIAVAAIMVSALVASSLFRNLALALAAGVVVLLYLQGGVAALIATSARGGEGNPVAAGLLQRPGGRAGGLRGAAAWLAEAVEPDSPRTLQHIHQLGDLAPLVGLVAARDRVLDAMSGVVAQDLVFDRAKRGTHRR